LAIFLILYKSDCYRLRLI